MAASKMKTAAVGSANWIQSERDQARVFVDQEAEEFSFSVRNDLEWLNEHMAEVLSDGNVNLADIFKTPGKLRGKTPRTARKTNALPPQPRQPLTDIFAPNTQIAPLIAPKNAIFNEKVAHFHIAEDQDTGTTRPTSRSKSPQRVGKPGNTDSGYHGMTEDEMEADAKTETETNTASASSQGRQEEEGHVSQQVPVREDQARPQPVRMDTAEGGDESFMSAKEDQTSRNASREGLREEAHVEVEIVDNDEENMPEQVEEAHEDEPEQDVDEDVTPHSPSDDASSPEKPLQRKSSFTFSALPAREPLTAKRSIGGRASQIEATRNSVLARSFGAKSLGVRDTEDDTATQEMPEASKAHQKTTTQLLHERITMLGKTKEPRMSKSISQNMLGAATYPKLPVAEPETEKDVDMEVDEDEDDWIAPSKPQPAAPAPVVVTSNTPQGSPARPPMHQKSISAAVIPSPSRMAMTTAHQKAQSVSNPSLANVAGTTTPFGSPMGKKHHEGPLSASKNKLWSALKSAKNIFASSASASAAAKLEAHNSSAIHRSPKRDLSGESKTAAVFNMPGALWSERQLRHSPSKPDSIISASPSRKTRSSNESDRKREKELKAQQKAADELEKVREKERQKAAKQLEAQRKADEAQAEAERKEQERLAAAAAIAAAAQAERPVSSGSDHAETAPPPPPKSMLPAGKLRAPGRLMRPAKAETATRPAPVAIRIASQSQRMGQAGNAALSKSQHESLAPPPKTGLRTASSQNSMRSSVAPNSARVKALEAAARKKEADEKAAARKLEQKRELERKRAAKLEEERRAEEERKAAEQARIQEARLAAQRKAEAQAAEARRKEQVRLEQQRAQEEAQKAKAAHELAEVIKRERAQQAPPHARGDVGGTLRQLAKNTVPDHSQQQGGNRAPLQPNPAKPAKRVFQPEEDELLHVQHTAAQAQRPGMPRGPPSYQQNDAKRRRTNEEEQGGQAERHSVMAPPKRPSNMRKESTLSKFPHGYAHAPPPAAHHGGAGGSMFKSTVTAQHQLHHGAKPAHPSQTVQMSNARIPFAENNNPPATTSQQYQQQTYSGHENTHPSAQQQNKFKTPARPAQAPKSAKSSPLYPNGDAIQLPEILTDSEDEEDDEDEAPGGGGAGFRAPSWVASPALRDLLTSQQLIDPESVFGPIGELKMEEVFKGGKNAERMKRFRDRGSSAAWVESGDAVTSAEKRRDLEGRERLVREGGWRFDATR
ncbi:hypothetical protein LTR78_009830 [Recurvomyces mirabilis]|uniref:Inner centromere protein ARK-binding domain-containing protein n=1 Tax=Recurvomyces mirabilis TaxID=574656 RepID=A0AAE0TT59_9PEZI|nr:hypothetical protein LTR78_009830 [Recurvomyces mirabilis]KAK5153066.1 hypothetical protein LTS14_007710 [Recurvomyces mirabilis]